MLERKKGDKMKSKNAGKIGANILIILIFLISSTAVVNAAVHSGYKAISIEMHNNDLLNITSDYNDRYAVIIVGVYQDPQHYRWFTRDAQYQYNVLTEKYGFSDDNIFVLLTLKEGEEWEENLSCDPSIIDMKATETNIINVFKNFESGGEHELGTCDLLFVEVISHGMDLGWLWGKGTDLWPNGHDTYFGLEEKDGLYLSDGIMGQLESNELPTMGHSVNASLLAPNNKVFDWELALYTRCINARRIVFVLQPCFSGGFIRELSGKNRVIYSASKENELAPAPFIGYFREGLNGNADISDDGRISLGEVYEYAAKEIEVYLENHPDEGPQHPLIDDNGDEVGHHYTQPCYDPDTKGKDGYVAARIYDLYNEDDDLSNNQSNQQNSQQATTTTTTKLLPLSV